MPRSKGESRNVPLARGISALSKSKMFTVSHKQHHAKKGGAAKDTAKAAAPASKFYPADQDPKPLHRNFKPKAAKLRASITPGTVLVLLAGAFRGCRVVFLKQLPSGLLLVTGPMKLNGCPLRRVNQAYVIATSAKVDVSGVEVPASINDAAFKKDKSGASTGVSDEKKAAQKAVDTAILSKLDDITKAYLKAKFTLTKNDKPHALKF